MAKNLPVIVLTANLVPFPDVELTLDVGRVSSVNALKDSEKNYKNKIILLPRKNIEEDILTNHCKYALVAELTNVISKPKDTYRVVFKPLYRCEIISLSQDNDMYIAEYENADWISPSDSNGTINTILKMIKTYNMANSFDNFDQIRRSLRLGLSENELLNLLCANIRIKGDKFKYLEELSNYGRALLLLEDINQLANEAVIDSKIDDDVKKSIDESQKEFYLREKMRAIQNELGDKARQDEEVETLRKTLKELNLPDNIYNKAIKELERYSIMSNQNPESNVIRNYLDLIVKLPWNNSTKDNDDLEDIKNKLDSKHYGLQKVKERIIEYIAVKMMTGKNPSTILCFAGPPGVGKTSLATSICEALGRNFVKQSVGGVRDEAEIRGHRRTYLGALPGRIIKGMKDAGSINPVYLLDEIDKMTSDYRGDPAAAMLEVLDPEQNNKFSDNYLEEPYDLSQVMFITTANDISNIPGPLRDRMEIIELSSYTEIEKFNIVRKHLLPRQLEAHGIDDSHLEILDDAIYAIIQHYTREAGVRELDRLIAKICRKTVTKVLLNKEDKVVVTKENVTDYLGKYRFFNNDKRENEDIGVVTGLAYTDFGGDTLDIEATKYQGKGMLKLTGKLGDVMKESAETALSFVKANADKYNINQDFNNIDIHIHVPEGAVPKDGPSAGVTLTTAIISLLTNKKVPSTIGMTGEITLRGKVLPIGGLREKSIAALRSGLTKIFIPKENERDLDEVPNEVKEKLEIKAVSNINEILNDIFQ